LIFLFSKVTLVFICRLPYHLWKPGRLA